MYSQVVRTSHKRISDPLEYSSSRVHSVLDVLCFFFIMKYYSEYSYAKKPEALRSSRVKHIQSYYTYFSRYVLRVCWFFFIFAVKSFPFPLNAFRIATKPCPATAATVAYLIS